jgi:hypothetical protein
MAFVLRMSCEFVSPACLGLLVLAGHCTKGENVRFAPIIVYTRRPLHGL